MTGFAEFFDRFFTILQLYICIRLAVSHAIPTLIVDIFRTGCVISTFTYH